MRAADTIKFGVFETKPGLSRASKWLLLVHDVEGNDVAAKLALDEGELLPNAEPDIYNSIKPVAGALKAAVAAWLAGLKFNAERRLTAGEQ